MRSLAKLVELYRQARNDALVAQTYSLLVEAYLDEGGLDQAASILEMLVQLEPHNEQHRTKLAWLREQQEPAAASRCDLQRPPLLRRAGTLARAGGPGRAGPPAAIELSGPLSAEDQEFIGEHLAEGRVFRKYGLGDKARDQFEAVLGRFPDNLDALQELVDLHKEKGETEAAARRLRVLAEVQRLKGDAAARRARRRGGRRLVPGRAAAPAVRRPPRPVRRLRLRRRPRRAASRPDGRDRAPPRRRVPTPARGLGPSTGCSRSSAGGGARRGRAAPARPGARRCVADRRLAGREAGRRRSSSTSRSRRPREEEPAFEDDPLEPEPEAEPAPREPEIPAAFDTDLDGSEARSARHSSRRSPAGAVDLEAEPAAPASRAGGRLSPTELRVPGRGGRTGRARPAGRARGAGSTRSSRTSRWASSTTRRACSQRSRHALRGHHAALVERVPGSASSCPGRGSRARGRDAGLDDCRDPRSSCSPERDGALDAAALARGSPARPEPPLRSADGRWTSTCSATSAAGGRRAGAAAPFDLAGELPEPEPEDEIAIPEAPPRRPRTAASISRPSSATSSAPSRPWPRSRRPSAPGPTSATTRSPTSSSEFQKGVDKQLGKEDYETRYNLGIAYKEMGLVDEAIAEFQLAAKDEGAAARVREHARDLLPREGHAEARGQVVREGAVRPRPYRRRSTRG